MKIPKLLTICLVICCLFAGNAFALFHGLGVAKESRGPSGPSIPVYPGEELFFRVLINNTLDEAGDTIHVYHFQDTTHGSTGDVISPKYAVGVFEWVFSGGASFNDPVTKDYIVMPPGSTAAISPAGPYPSSTYIVQDSDVGFDPSGKIFDDLAVFYFDICDGTDPGGCPDPQEELIQEAAASIPVIPLPVPCVAVEKTACPYSKVDDEVVFDITISNCGEEDLELVQVYDELLGGDITSIAQSAGCSTIPVGDSCNFQVLYVVQPDDDTGPDAILVNVVIVNYTGAITGETVVADDDAAVTLLHPSFTLDVECVEIFDGTALFEANFCNTGDVGLMVDPNDLDIGDPFPLPVSEECVPYFIQIPVEQGACGAATASKTISALASIMLPPDTPQECLLGNIITPEPAEDTATCTANVNPSFTAEKVCLDTTPEATADGFAAYQINFENTSTGDVPVQLLFEIDDPAADSYFEVLGPFSPGAGDSVVVQVPVSVQIGDCPAPDISNSATVTGICLADQTRLEPQIVNATCPGPCADFDVEKTCLTTTGLTDGSIAEYGIVITNTGTVPLNLVINDPSAEPALVDVPVTLGPGEPYSTTVTRTVVCTEPGEYTIENTVSVVAVAPDGTQIGPKTSTAECPYTCAGGEGCTPGYWKNSPGCWGCYSTTTKLNQVFDFPGSPAKLVALGNTTLLDALSLPGGTTKIEKAQILMRHAVAAVLNACSGNVEYPDSVAGIVEDVNEILANWSTVTGKDILSLKNQFKDWNELGCPISSEKSKNPCQRKNGY